MQIKTFTYTKADNSVSKRVALVVQDPSNMFLMQDMSELDTEAQAMYAVRMSKLQDEFNAKIADLNAEFDMRNRLRKFDPLRMTDVETEHVA